MNDAAAESWPWTEAVTNRRIRRDRALDAVFRAAVEFGHASISIDAADYLLAPGDPVVLSVGIPGQAVALAQGELRQELVAEAAEQLRAQFPLKDPVEAGRVTWQRREELRHWITNNSVSPGPDQRCWFQLNILLDELDDYHRAEIWMVDCLNCGSLLDQTHNESSRADDWRQLAVKLARGRPLSEADREHLKQAVEGAVASETLPGDLEPAGC